MIIFLFVL